MTWLALYLPLGGCGPAPLDAGFDGGPAFTISGEVAADVEVSGDLTRGAVAFAWNAQGYGGTRIVESRFEPRIWSYALEVPPPPAADATGAPPEDLAGLPEGAVLIGLPFLWEPDGDGVIDPRFDADLTLGWFQGETPPLTGGSGRVAALPADHLIVLYAGEAPTLGEDPTFDGDCALDAVVPGLTLYRRDGTGCGSFHPVALPGERLEFQGVRVIAPE